jgi:hypothetical protein
MPFGFRDELRIQHWLRQRYPYRLRESESVPESNGPAASLLPRPRRTARPGFTADHLPRRPPSPMGEVEPSTALSRSRRPRPPHRRSSCASKDRERAASRRESSGRLAIATKEERGDSQEAAKPILDAFLSWCEAEQPLRASLLRDWRVRDRRRAHRARMTEHVRYRA